MTKIAVIIGSTRQGRQSDRLAKWVVKNLAEKAEAELLDLREYSMPLFNEEISPRYNPERKADAETQKWLDKVAEFDGYVIVTPEYNRAAPGVLKNAIDVLAYEMEQKPVALVGHGSSGGAQAVGGLRLVVPGVGAFTIPQALYFSDQLAGAISEDGELNADIKARPHGPQANLETQIDSLLWYAEALKAAKQ